MAGDLSLLYFSLNFTWFSVSVVFFQKGFVGDGEASERPDHSPVICWHWLWQRLSCLSLDFRRSMICFDLCFDVSYKVTTESKIKSSIYVELWWKCVCHQPRIRCRPCECPLLTSGHSIEDKLKPDWLKCIPFGHT